MAEQCPVCGSTAPPAYHQLYTHVYNCPRCGLWSLNMVHSGLTMMLTTKLGNWDEKSVHLRSPLSHIIRRQQREDGGWVQVPLELESWHLELPLPSPQEQLDRLIIAVGDSQPSSAKSRASQRLVCQHSLGQGRQSQNAGLGWLLAQQNKSIA